MAEESDDEAEEPTVELGDGGSVEGAPIARIAARFVWGVERSEIIAREGEAEIRTAEGPRKLADILEQTEETYFPTRQAFVSAVNEVVATGPVPTVED